MMLQGTKKRRLPTSEFAGKFESKADLIKYFKEQRKYPLIVTTFCPVQLYVPDDTMINKDFLKQVLTEEKELIPIRHVNFVNVPMYDELSVKRLWPDMRMSPDFMKFFPDKLPKGRLPSREYFFNVMNTINEEYMARLIKHANE